MSRARGSRYVPGVPGQRRLYFARLDVIKSNVASPMKIIPIPSSQHVSIRGKGHTVDCFVAPQGRLTLKGARRPYRPDLDRLVHAAASDEFAISTEADRIDPVLEIGQHVQDGGMNSSNTGNKLTSGSARSGSTRTQMCQTTLRTRP